MNSVCISWIDPKHTYNRTIKLHVRWYEQYTNTQTLEITTNISNNFSYTNDNCKDYHLQQNASCDSFISTTILTNKRHPTRAYR
jgi:hypothetical protein